MAPRFQEFTTTSTSSDRRPLGEANRDLKLLSSIPESKPAEKNNVSRAVFVKDGMGHELEEDIDNDEGWIYIKKHLFSYFRSRI